MCLGKDTGASHPSKLPSLTLLNQLLHLLSDGAFHSGTQLGQHLNISRAAVWKQLRGIEALGISLHRVRGKGYRIYGGLDLLDLEAIYRDQPALQTVFQIHLLMQTESTNQVLMQASSQGQDILGQVILAELQTQGRGRNGQAMAYPLCATIGSLGGLAI